MATLSKLRKFRFSTIRTKITVMSIAAIAFLVIVGGITTMQIYSLNKASAGAIKHSNQMLDLVQTMSEVRANFQHQVQEWKDTLLRGNSLKDYAHYHGQFETRLKMVIKGLKEARVKTQKYGLTKYISTQEIDNLLKLHDGLDTRYANAVAQYDHSNPGADHIVDKMVRGMDRPFTAALTKVEDKLTAEATQDAKDIKALVASKSSKTLTLSIILLILSIPALGALGYFIGRGIIRNLDSFQKTVNDINQGDFEARAQIKTKDELGELATVFNQLLDNRVATLAKIQRDNEQLNESVVALLQSVAKLAQKDLTIKVPVSEDVTGAVADSLNLLADETSKVLKEVSNISADVTAASMKVQEQASGMLRSSEEDRAEVDLAANTLSSAAQSLNEIATLAQQCNMVADNAIQSTQMALASVNNTVEGINSTRDVIRETEKRIKRLGERSQEISGAVNLINVIAERTHILALNASMHAASAGEAGRGFAVVADEVQRLAENSRQATQQIAALVNNIQVETSDTVNTMNDAITQIVEGSRLAEQAGQQMQLTQQTTSELVSSVRRIASNSTEQAKAGQELLERAETLRKSSERSSLLLHEQSDQTNDLVEYAKDLLTTVRVFKLPA